MKNPYQIVKSLHITEKTHVLQQLQHAKSNPSLSGCNSPKYVFIVDVKANKRDVAEAVTAIYAEQNIKVLAVNTINVKPKPKNRRGKGRPGSTAAFKKAIVTLEPGDSIE